MHTYINVRIDWGLVAMGYGVDVMVFGTMASSHVIYAFLCAALNGPVLTMGFLRMLLNGISVTISNVPVT